MVSTSSGGQGEANHLMGIKVLSGSVSSLILHHYSVGIGVPYYSLVRMEVYIPYLAFAGECVGLRFFSHGVWLE